MPGHPATTSAEVTRPCVDSGASAKFVRKSVSSPNSPKAVGRLAISNNRDRRSPNSPKAVDRLAISNNRNRHSPITIPTTMHPQPNTAQTLLSTAWRHRVAAILVSLGFGLATSIGAVAQPFGKLSSIAPPPKFTDANRATKLATAFPEIDRIMSAFATRHRNRRSIPRVCSASHQ